MTYWELFPFSAWAKNNKLLEVNHSVVVSSLITCLIWGITSKQRYFMNEQLKLAKKYFIPSPYKGDTQFGTKKRKKERPRHRTAQQQDMDIFLIPWRSTNHRNVQEKHQYILACHLFLSLLRWPNHTPTVYTDKRNFSKSWLSELWASESKSKTSLDGQKFATTARPYKKTNRNILTLSPSTCMIFFDLIVEQGM